MYLLLRANSHLAEEYTSRAAVAVLRKHTAMFAYTQLLKPCAYLVTLTYIKKTEVAIRHTAVSVHIHPKCLVSKNSSEVVVIMNPFPIISA